MDDHRPHNSAWRCQAELSLGGQNSAYRLPFGRRWGGGGRKTPFSPEFPAGEGIGMLTGVRLERVRKAMQAVEDRVVGNNKRPSPPISRKGDKVVQKEEVRT